MANSIYDYTGFYTQAEEISNKKETPTYTNREMLQKLYNNNSVFWSSAKRGDGNSTQIAASEILIDKKQVDSTEYNQYLSRFKNLPNIQFAKGKLYQDNTIGTSNIANAQASDFGQVDAEWVSSRFMTGSEHLSNLDAMNRFFTTTGWKFDSTKWGQNMAINPRPQFTRTCDIRGNNRNTTAMKDSDGKGMSIYGKHHGSNEYGIDVLAPGETQDHLDFGLGMGRYYSEAIDDNATQIYLQFGVPKFNSLISFFINAVSYEDSYIANYGRLPVAYDLASKVFGFVVWCAFPLITTTIFLLKKIISFTLEHPFNYYYMEPTMHTYWTSVNLIVNQLAAELGIMAPVLMDDTGPDEKEKNTKIGVPVRVSSSDIAELSKYMPNLFNKDTGYIDIYHLATRGQMLANYLQKKEYELYNDASNTPAKIIPGWKGNSEQYFKKTHSILDSFINGIDKKLYLRDFLTRLLKPSSADEEFVKDSRIGNGADVKAPTQKEGTFSFRKGGDDAKYTETPEQLLTNTKQYCLDLGVNQTTIDDTIKKVEESEDYKKEGITPDEQNDLKRAALNALVNSNVNTTQVGNTKNSSSTDDKGWFVTKAEGLWDSITKWALGASDAFDAAVRDGGGYAIFNVDYNGTVTESWSNSTSEIETAGLTKSVAKGARDIRFNLAGGLLATAVGQVVDGLKNVVMAGVETFSFGLSNVVASLLGGGYADIPKRWDDSDFSFPKINYTIQLVAPYGNPISQMQNIYIPLAMIMAGSLPLQAGKSSYTSPFLCSIYNKGVQDVRLGMITDVTVTRGITNLPFSRTKRMLSCEVSFSVTDFSTRLVAPINSSPFKTLFSLNWDDDTPTGIYFATLASRDLFTNKYLTPRSKMKLARMMMAFSQATSPSSFGMRQGEPGTVLNKLFGIFASERRFPESQRNSI